jgi:hypothetical protein
MNGMSRYPSNTPSPAPLSAASTKPRNVHAPRAGAEARLLGDRDEVPQMPQFDVHRQRNPNRHAITATVDTIASREA